MGIKEKIAKWKASKVAKESLRADKERVRQVEKRKEIGRETEKEYAKSIEDTKSASAYKHLEEIKEKRRKIRESIPKKKSSAGKIMGNIGRGASTTFTGIQQFSHAIAPNPPRSGGGDMMGMGGLGISGFGQPQRRSTPRKRYKKVAATYKKVNGGFVPVKTKKKSRRKTRRATPQQKSQSFDMFGL